MSIAAQVIGMSPVTMQSIQGNANTAITAAGTTLATATDLTNTVNIVTTATADQGVQLLTGIVGDSQIVYNNTLVNIKVYPSSATAKINQMAVGTAHVLAPQTCCIYFIASATQHVANLSA
jgi:hypothetical protein